MNENTPVMGDSTSRRRIVVLNDSWDLLRLMKELLEEEGYAVDIMHAAEGAHERIKEINPALVILDLVLEKPDAGWMLLQILKLDPKTVGIPVILCSAASTFLQAHREQLDQLGCHVLHKPFDLDQLIKMVQEALDTSPA